MAEGDKIAVSVIIPVYNLETLLPVCLDSLLSQTMPDLEILCVDDGSGDASRQVVESYCEKDCRVHLFCQNHRGVSQARNLGIRNAGGKYVLFVDGDDWVEPNMLETMLARAEETGSDMVVCSAHVHFLAPEQVSSRQQKSLRRALCAEPDQWNRGRNTEEIWDTASKPACWPFIWNKLIRRAILVEHQLQFPPGLPLGEDGLFLLVLMQYVSRVDFLPQALYHYRYLRSASATARLSVSLDTRFPQHCQVASCLAEQFFQRELLEENGPYLLGWITEFLYRDYLKLSQNGTEKAAPLVEHMFRKYGLLNYAQAVNSNVRKQAFALVSPRLRNSGFYRKTALIHHKMVHIYTRYFLRDPKA